MGLLSDLRPDEPVAERELRRIAANMSQLTDSDPISDIQRALDCFLAAALSTEVSPSHRTAACNTLCALLLRTLQLDSQTAETVCSRSALLDTFEVFASRSDVSKSRPMRQILSSIATILLRLLAEKDGAPEWQRQVGLAVRADILGRCSQIMVSKVDRIRLKPAIQTLTLFLSKRVCSIDDLLQVVIENSSGEAASSVDEFMRAMFGCVLCNDAAPATGTFISTFISTLKTGRSVHLVDVDEAGLPVWVRLLDEMVEKRPESITNFQHHVFPALFSISPTDYLACLNYFGYDAFFLSTLQVDTAKSAQSKISHEGLRQIVFKMLQTGKENGLVVISDSVRITIENSKIRLPAQSVGRYLAFTDVDVRASALSLLITSASQTTAMTATSLRMIFKTLESQLSDPDANFRGQFLGLMQRLVDRMRTSMATMWKQHKQPKELSEIQNTSWNSYMAFLQNLRSRIVLALVPTCTYQRRICALRILAILLRSGIDERIRSEYLAKMAHVDLGWPVHIEFLTRPSVRRIGHLLVDPYDDIRQTASSVFSIVIASLTEPKEITRLALPGTSRPATSFPNPFWLLAKFDDLEQRTGRADHADGFGRCHVLAYEYCVLKDLNLPVRLYEQAFIRLARRVAAAEADLQYACRNEPLQGSLSGLRHIFEKLRTSPGGKITASDFNGIDLVIRLIERVWKAVMPVLCADAPEGHLPDDPAKQAEVVADNGDEDAAGDVDMSSKTVVSFAWRSLRESSLLGRELAMLPSLGPAQLRRLGNLSFTQLVQLRHRGAFSTVAQTFTAICKLTAADKVCENWVDDWYRQAIELVTRTGPTITRRSAGIPALMVSLATASSAVLSRAVVDLGRVGKSVVEKNEAIDDSRPQVHALNCLRALFTTSQLGDDTDRFVGLGLEIATTLQTDVWPVRNAGLMLFRALIDRMLGTGTNGPVGSDGAGAVVARTRFSYDRFPEIVQTIFDYLSLDEADSVFPALYILQRAPLPAEHASRARDLVTGLLSDRQWHVRDMAARTVSGMIARPDISQQEVLAEIESLMAAVDGKGSSNQVHGHLLAIRYIVESYLVMGTRTGFAAILALAGRFDPIRLAGCPPLIDAWTDLLAAASKSVYLRSPDDRQSTDYDAGFRSVCAVVHGFVALSAVEIEDSTMRDRLLWRAAHRAVCEVEIEQLLHSPPADQMSRVMRDWTVADQLVHLAEHDVDECCSLIDRLGLLSDVAETLTTEIRSSVSAMLANVVSRTDRHLVWARALGLLPTILPPVGDEKRFGSTDIYSGLDLHVKLAPCLKDLVEQTLENPTVLPTSLVDGLIPVWAWAWTVDHAATGTETDLVMFIALLERSLCETTEWSRRYAASQALVQLMPWIMSGPRYESVFASKTATKAGFMIAHLLVDDSDEIRQIGSELVDRLSRARPFQTERVRQGAAEGNDEDEFPTGFPVVPAIASQALARLLTEPIETSVGVMATVFRMSLGRAMAVPMSLNERDRRAAYCNRTFCRVLLSVPAERTLAVVLDQADDLFSVERQNLFVDPADEVGVWGAVAAECVRVLMSRWPAMVAREPFKEMIKDLIAWTEGAVTALVQAQKTEEIDMCQMYDQSKKAFQLAAAKTSDDETDSGEADCDLVDYYGLYEDGMIRPEDDDVSILFTKPEVYALTLQAKTMVRHCSNLIELLTEGPARQFARVSDFFSPRWLPMEL